MSLSDVYIDKKLPEGKKSRQERPEKYYWFEHAERNSIYNAARSNPSIENKFIGDTSILGNLEKMASDNYIKIFQGSFIESNRLVVELKNINISPIVKNEMESARLAGFGSANLNSICLFI